MSVFNFFKFCVSWKLSALVADFSKNYNKINNVNSVILRTIALLIILIKDQLDKSTKYYSEDPNNSAYAAIYFWEKVLPIPAYLSPMRLKKNHIFQKILNLLSESSYFCIFGITFSKEIPKLVRMIDLGWKVLF